MPDTKQSPPTDLPKIDYPSQYTFKVMGRREDDFSIHVRGLFARVLATDIEASCVVEHESSKGTYVSVNVTVLLRAEEERRALYEALYADPRVVYYL